MDIKTLASDSDLIQIRDEREANILAEFRELVKDVEEDDITLLRFLRAREYDVKKAEDMLRKCIKWRKDNEISRLLEWNIPNLLVDAFPFELCGVNNSGGPVMWLPLGRWKGRQMVEQGFKQDCLKFGNYVVETGKTEVKRLGNRQCHVIIDAAQISLYQVAHIETMQTLFAGIRNFEQNYPELLRRIQVINAPWIFTMAFNFVKPILSAHTLAKVQVFGTNKKQWFPEMQKSMPVEAIPKEYLPT